LHKATDSALNKYLLLKKNYLSMGKKYQTIKTKEGAKRKLVLLVMTLEK
jgi:hypothetical protein